MFSQSFWIFVQKSSFCSIPGNSEKILSRKFFPLKSSSAQVERNGDNLAGSNFAKSPKIFLSRSEEFLQQRNFLIQNFFWESSSGHIEKSFYTHANFFFETANFSDQSPETFSKRYLSLKKFVFRHNFLGTHRWLFWRPCRSNARQSFESFSLKVRKYIWKGRTYWYQTFLSERYPGRLERNFYNQAKYFFSIVQTFPIQVRKHL